MPLTQGWITDMRLAVALVVALALQAMSAGMAFAGYDESQEWFQNLGPEQRSETQANLTLLGDYRYLVDGQFGTGTYNALTEFQRSQGSVKNGVLSSEDQQALQDLAAAAYSDLGMELVRDEEGQVELTIPTAVLTEKTQTAEGTSYTTEDGGMTVETIYKPSQLQSFADLYDQLSRSGKGRIVTSKSFNDELFLVTGHQDGRDFYLMYKNTGTGSVGYSLTWSLPYAARGNILSIYIASNFTPLSTLPPEVETRKAEAPTATRRFGAFSLPSNMPDVIALDGEVTGDFVADFERALEERPDATIMLLNSPGGYVDDALVVARTVHERGMSTVVSPGMGCYSACAYIFFAGAPREADGELGVHQISADVADLVLAQTTLSDVIDALNQFGVEQVVIVKMLRTPPEDMYVFSAEELADWEVNRGGPVTVAETGPVDTPDITPPEEDHADTGAEQLAFVHLAQQSSQAEAERSLKYAEDRWAGVLGDATPEIDRAELAQGTVYRVRVPARSLESANAMCEAIKSAGGGCYVTKVEN
jgi:peptidoglycan hydrolase-like protein with peptidoglycan-binding domain